MEVNSLVLVWSGCEILPNCLKNVDEIDLDG